MYLVSIIHTKGKIQFLPQKVSISDATVFPVNHSALAEEGEGKAFEKHLFETKVFTLGHVGFISSSLGWA